MHKKERTEPQNRKIASLFTYSITVDMVQKICVQKICKTIPHLLVLSGRRNEVDNIKEHWCRDLTSRTFHPF
jgi:hypothetical protein